MFAVILPGIFFPRVLMSQSVPRDGYLILISFSLLPNMQLSKNRTPSGHILLDLACFNCVSLHRPSAPLQMVDPVGLEPTTPALSRRCSNQLSYGSMICVMDRALSGLRSFVRGGPQLPQKWRHGDSNPRHPACKAGALPTELYPLNFGAGCSHGCGWGGMKND